MAFGGLLLFAVVAVWPVLTTRLLPVSDYVNHLARCYLIAGGAQDPLLAQFYAIKWALIPNLAMDLIVPPLSHILGIYGAGTAFLVLTMLLLLAGPHLVHRALFGRWSLGPLVAGLFLYNGAVEAGAANYLFGTGVALLGVAAWIALRPGAPLSRGMVSAVLVAALYICHFGALGLYGIALFGYEVWRVSAGTDGRRAWRGDLLALVLPFLALPALAAFGPGGDALLGGAIHWTLYDKLRGLFYVFESQSLSRLPDAGIGLVLIALALVAWWRGFVRLHPAGLAIAALGAVAYLATPDEIMTASGADTRQPLGYLFILIGFLEWRLLTSEARRAFLAAIVVLLVARTAVVDYAWSKLKPNIAEIDDSLALVEPGSKILIAEADSPRYLAGHTLHFLPCAAIIERSSLCSLAFSDPHQQVLRVKPPFRAITGGYDDDPPKWSELLEPPARSPETPSGRIYWVGWQRDYDYLYLLSTEPGDRNPLPGRLTRIYDARHFQLYAIKK